MMTTGIELPITDQETVVVLSVPYFEKIFQVLLKYDKRYLYSIFYLTRFVPSSQFVFASNIHVSQLIGI